MNKDEKIKLCHKIRAFLVAEKTLGNQIPFWTRSAYPDELSAKLPIICEGASCDARLVFRLDMNLPKSPSVSLIYRDKPVCRVDVLPKYISDKNPPEASRFNLPEIISGPHIHPWKYNEFYVLDHLPANEWHIPIKIAISARTRTPGQILACICHHCRIAFVSEQRSFDWPSRKEFRI